MSENRIRLYKYVTPPKEADGAQMTVSKKTFTTTGFVPTVKAINSLGATVNSIGIALKKNQQAQARIMEDQRRAAALQADRQREAAIEAEEVSADSAIRNTTGSAMGFMDYLWKFLKNLLIFGALNFLSKKENREKIIKGFEMISGFFKWIGDTINWWKQKFGELFGEDSDGWTRFKAAAKMLGAGIAVLAGIAFLKNPIGTIKAFSGIITTVGKGIMNLGKFLGGNALGQMAMAGAQGYMAYQDVMQNYDGAEEDRVAAARGAGVGAAGGGIALGMIGNKIAGPIGGLIGNAVGGLLGKEAGKFLGPMVGNFFNTMKEMFDTMMEFLDKLFKPLRDAIDELFKAMGPPLQMIVDAIKPHLPRLMSFAETMGTVVFFPLIKMLEGLTGFLKMIPGVQDRMDAADTTGDNTGNPDEMSKGGLIRPQTAVLPEKSKGGWISGPQSGYPVSLDGGKSVSFIGHGTEYVAQRSSGGFVIPFNTPHTKRDPGLTSRRMQQASAAGYKVPKFSKGGVVPFNFGGSKSSLTSPPALPPTNYGQYKGYSFGGFLDKISSVAANATLPPHAAAAMKFIKPHIESASENIGGVVNKVVDIMPPALKERTGKIIQKTVTNIKSLATKVKSDDLNAAVETIVADAIILPTEKTATNAGGGGTVVNQKTQPNPAAEFLTSRFGRVAEASSSLSNLF